MLAYLVAAAVIGQGLLQPVGFDLPSLGPAVYQLDGYLDTAPEGKVAQYSVVLGYGQQDRTLLVTKYALDGDGDAFVLFKNLGMYRPDFVLIGPGKAIETLVKAKPGSHVSGTFIYRRGMHILEVDGRDLKVE